MEFSAVNTIWVLLGAALVFFMQPGFAMVETGFTRAKNAGNIIMKNLLDLSIGAPVYWLVGFGIMFGTNNGWIGTIDFLTRGDYSAICGSFSRRFSARRVQPLFRGRWRKGRNFHRTAYIHWRSPSLSIPYRGTGFGEADGFRSWASMTLRDLPRYIWWAVCVPS